MKKHNRKNLNMGKWFYLCRWAVLIGAMVLVPFSAHAAKQQVGDPNAAKNQANSDIQVASKLMDQAASLLTGTPTRYALKTAIDLYSQAGQSAERAAQIYGALGPQYASREDVENSNLMVQRCIENIQQIKKRM